MVSFRAANLIRDFGRRSPLLARWMDSAPNATGDDAEIGALNAYYASLVAQFVLHFLAPGEKLAWQNSLFLSAGNIQNFLDKPNLPSVRRASRQHEAAKDALASDVFRYTFEDMPVDVLKTLHHHLFSPAQRQTGGEFYTPDWLARYVLDATGYDGHGRIYDPTCGSGTFLALALRRKLQHMPPEQALEQVGGRDTNGLAVLTAKANLIFAAGRPERPVNLNIYTEDILPKVVPHQVDGRFISMFAVVEPYDYVVGNPPWLNLENLSPEYRQRILPLWTYYDLFPHGGMNSILGTSKKDLSMLITCVAADKFLCNGGKMGFVVPLSLFKSGGAGAGFRRFQTLKSPLQIQQVDDLSAIQPFAGAAAAAAVMLLEKGTPTQYPVPYRVWSPRQSGRIPEDYEGALDDLFAYEMLEAEPAVADDMTSPWMTGRRSTLNAVQKLYGKSDYVAHAGAYTGGANGVYWLDILEHLPDNRVRVRNITERAKSPVPQVEAILEADLIYPLLRGRDVRRWSAQPGAHILLVQNPQTRRGYDVDWLRAHYPLTYNYLAQFEDALRARSTYRRYFREHIPFYTMFDVGQYTLAKVKVVWQGMGVAEMQAAVVNAGDGRPVITNQAMHPFIGLDDEHEAHYLAAYLNSIPFELAVLSHTQPRGRSFAQPGILNVLRIPRYQPGNATHQKLAALSMQAHERVSSRDAIENEMAETVAALRGISAAELQDMRRQIQRYRPQRP